jgi:50S ribosomal subunit-associated GTPase HflX
MQREQHRKSRARLGLPVVALVGYTNAGKSSLLNRLSRAGEGGRAFSEVQFYRS